MDDRHGGHVCSRRAVGSGGSEGRKIYRGGHGARGGGATPARGGSVGGSAGYRAFVPGAVRRQATLPTAPTPLPGTRPGTTVPRLPPVVPRGWAASCITSDWN